MVAVKICGVTSVADALDAAEAGADAIGLNFYPASPRCVAVDTAREIASAVGDRVLTVGVFVDMDSVEIESIRAATGLRCVQLHGDEPPSQLLPLLPHAYKALRVRGSDVLKEAARYAGEHILLDAYVPGQPGGTGATFDWAVARSLSGRRHVTLAGGLTPDNVAEAVRAVRPFCVDVASGVESAPGHKDPARVRAFIAAARAADARAVDD